MPEQKDNPFAPFDPEDVLKEDSVIFGCRPVATCPESPYEGCEQEECGGCDIDIWVCPRVRAKRKEVADAGKPTSTLCIICVARVQNLMTLKQPGSQMKVADLGGIAKPGIQDMDSPEMQALVERTMWEYEQQRRKKKDGNS